MASKLGKEIQICKANLIVLLLQVCDEPVETGKYICMELGGKDIQVRWLNHFAIHLKLTQDYKSTISQHKIKIKLKNKICNNKYNFRVRGKSA